MPQSTTQVLDIGCGSSRLEEALSARVGQFTAIDVSAKTIEAARVLKPGGALLIFNFSYRDDDAADRADVNRLAAASGLAVEVAGQRVFKLWDATAFLSRRPASPACTHPSSVVRDSV